MRHMRPLKKSKSFKKKIIEYSTRPRAIARLLRITRLTRLIRLEQRQYKNDSIQSKIVPILKLARFIPHCLGGEKERQFQSWNYF